MARILVAIVGLSLLTPPSFGQPAGDASPPTVPEMASLIASYPKDLWEPMLTLASHPNVLEQLAKKAPADTAAAGKGEAIKQAAAAMAKEPEAARALSDDKAGAKVIGQAFNADKQKVLAEVAKEANVESKATDEWSKRLSADGDAIDQLTAALKAYPSLSANDATSEAGVSINNGAINVNALPSPGFVNYVMSNADVYPALSDVMVSQWLGGKNTWWYDHSFHHWWDHFHNNFHDEHFFHNDEHRRDRIADAARYDKKYAKDDHRWDHFNEHRNEFEHLRKVNPPPKDHKPEPHRKPQVQGGGEHHVQHKPVAGRHPAIRRGHATHHAQAHHAAHAHSQHAAHRGGKR